MLSKQVESDLDSLPINNVNIKMEHDDYDSSEAAQLDESLGKKGRVTMDHFVAD